MSPHITDQHLNIMLIIQRTYCIKGSSQGAPNVSCPYLQRLISIPGTGIVGETVKLYLLLKLIHDLTLSRMFRP